MKKNDQYNFILSGTQLPQLRIFDGDTELGYGTIRSVAGAILEISNNDDKDRGIAILLDRGAQYIGAMIACWLLGRYVIPLNTGWPDAKISSILDRINPCMVIASADYSGDLSNYHCCDFQTLAERGESTDLAMQAMRPSDIAYVIFTSGSTGEPKGVAISAQSFREYINWTERYFVDYADCKALLNSAELTFDITMGDIAFGLSFGTAIGIAKNNSNIPAMLGMIVKFQIDVFYSVPTTHLAMVDFAKRKRGARLDSLRLIMSGGDVFPWSLVDDYGERAPHSHFYNVYGPTEVTINCFAVRLDSFVRNIEGNEAVPIGKCFDIIDFRILDEEGNASKPGDLGELCVSGPQMMMGYCGDKTLSESAFVRDPEAQHVERSMYKTGDLAYVADNGLVYLRGRKDALVKIKGYRIHPNEVNDAISGLADVSDSAVVPVGQPTSLRLVAFVITNHSKVSSDSIRAALRAKVPEYMLPDEFLFVDNFPLNQSGKIDKRQLRKQLDDRI
ncbi:MAG: AMP-binding protein [Boseongicola sp.]